MLTRAQPGRIEKCAEISVGRGCSFAGIAILTFMVGLSWDLALACKVGGMLELLVCAVLLLKEVVAKARSYKRTEVWLMLSESERPNSDVAQRLISAALSDSYLRHAQHAALIAFFLLSASIAATLLAHRYL